MPGIPEAPRSRPYQNCTTAEQYHWPPMLTHMPSVYCEAAVAKRGVDPAVGSDPLRSKSTQNESGKNVTLVILAVSAQLAKSCGELTIFACDRLNGW